MAKENRGKMVRDARLERGWTLKDLAEKTGVSISRISRIENGDGTSDEVWQALAKPLHMEFIPSQLRRKP